ncbi:DUF7882 family protein [Microbacterium aureliae]
MGRLTYGGVVTLEIEERTLAHLQIVINQKLRRGEPFHLTWAHDTYEGGGRTSIWIHPGARLVYRFQIRGRHEINHRWIEEMLRAANSTGGLYVMPEPTDS